jgi:hypothetical protein
MLIVVLMSYGRSNVPLNVGNYLQVHKMSMQKTLIKILIAMRTSHLMWGHLSPMVG